MGGATGALDMVGKLDDGRDVVGSGVGIADGVFVGLADGSMVGNGEGYKLGGKVGPEIGEGDSGATEGDGVQAAKYQKGSSSCFLASMENKRRAIKKIYRN